MKVFKHFYRQPLCLQQNLCKHIVKTGDIYSMSTIVCIIHCHSCTHVIFKRKCIQYYKVKSIQSLSYFKPISIMEIVECYRG